MVSPTNLFVITNYDILPQIQNDMVLHSASLVTNICHWGCARSMKDFILMTAYSASLAYGHRSITA